MYEKGCDTLFLLIWGFSQRNYVTAFGVYIYQYIGMYIDTAVINYSYLIIYIFEYVFKDLLYMCSADSLQFVCNDQVCSGLNIV